MNISINNYNKPSHKTFKLIADIGLFAIPLYIPIIMPLPINDNIKLWIISGLSFLLANIKILSKFSLDTNYVDNNIKSTEESPQ